MHSSGNTSGNAMSNQTLLKLFKQRHVMLTGFIFVQAKDKVHKEIVGISLQEDYYTNCGGNCI